MMMQAMAVLLALTLGSAVLAQESVGARLLRAAVSAPDEVPKPTRRKREVLTLTVQLERCRAQVAGFADATADLWHAWKTRHADTLAVYERQLKARVRDANRMEPPPPQCTDPWIQEIEALAQLPDRRFDTVEKTWSLFVDALKSADRATALSCLTGKAEARWKASVEKLTNEDLRRIGVAIRTLRVQWGDDYEKEAVVEGDDNRIGAVTFRNRNEEWKIEAL